jgi:hypothetical protein
VPALTRRRSTDAREECWHIYYGDVHAGTIAIRSGIPYDEDPWGWHCGFYPGSHPGEHQSGTAPTFDHALSDFEEAWKAFLANRGLASLVRGTTMNKPDDDRVVEELGSYSAAMTAAFQVLIHCLQSNGALKRGQYSEELIAYLNATKDKSSPTKNAILNDLRQSLLD